MGLQHYTQDMSRIPLKYHTKVLFYTKYTHPMLICRGTDARTDTRTYRRSENIYSIFRDKLLLLGEHVYIEQDLPDELISWLSYLFFPAIIAVLSGCHLAVSGVTAIPIYFWTLLWHPDGRSIFDMLCNPEGNGHLI
jgi:hypothetical protein